MSRWTSRRGGRWPRGWPPDCRPIDYGSRRMVGRARLRDLARVRKVPYVRSRNYLGVIIPLYGSTQPMPLKKKAASKRKRATKRPAAKKKRAPARKKAARRKVAKVASRKKVAAKKKRVSPKRKAAAKKAARTRAVKKAVKRVRRVATTVVDQGKALGERMAAGVSDLFEHVTHPSTPTGSSTPTT